MSVKSEVMVFLKKYIAEIITISSVLIILAVILYKISRRVESIADLPSNYKNTVLNGIVTYVADGDTFRFYHCPFLRSKSIDKKIKTLPIRIAGIDSPEMAHNGFEEQPLAREAKKLLSDLILLKEVKIKILRIDRYYRPVASVYVKRWCWSKNISLEMVKYGMACVYIGSDAEYDDFKEDLLAAESQAKRNRIGIWKLKNFVSPMDYKRNKGK